MDGGGGFGGEGVHEAAADSGTCTGDDDSGHCRRWCSNVNHAGSFRNKEFLASL